MDCGQKVPKWAGTWFGPWNKVVCGQFRSQRAERLARFHLPVIARWKAKREFHLQVRRLIGFLELGVEWQQHLYKHWVVFPTFSHMGSVLFLNGVDTSKKLEGGLCYLFPCKLSPSAPCNWIYSKWGRNSVTRQLLFLSSFYMLNPQNESMCTLFPLFYFLTYPPPPVWISWHREPEQYSFCEWKEDTGGNGLEKETIPP